MNPVGQLPVEDTLVAMVCCSVARWSVALKSCVHAESSLVPVLVVQEAPELPDSLLLLRARALPCRL